MIARQLRHRIVLVLVVLALTCIAVPAIRHAILRAAGWALVVNDCDGPFDVIVVSGESDGAGMLEASDLVHRGVSTRVAVFAYAPNTVEQEFRRRGIAYEDRTPRYLRQLKALGLTNAEQIPEYIQGSEDEGPALTRWCDQQKIHSVVVVASGDHSRRLRRLFHRSVRGHQTTVAVCSARFSEFDPDHWWTSHSGIRTEVMEWEKLLLDMVRHPIS